MRGLFYQLYLEDGRGILLENWGKLKCEEISEEAKGWNLKKRIFKLQSPLMKHFYWWKRKNLVDGFGKKKNFWKSSKSFKNTFGNPKIAETISSNFEKISQEKNFLKSHKIFFLRVRLRNSCFKVGRVFFSFFRNNVYKNMNINFFQ